MMVHPSISTPVPRGKKVLEKVCGTFQAVTKVPSTLIPATVGGVVHAATGRRMNEKQLGYVLDAVGAVQVACAVAFALSNGNFMSALLTRGVWGGLGAFMVSRGGSNRKLAREIIDGIGPKGNVFKGFAQGVKTGVVGAARTGWCEGIGYANGLWAVKEELPAILSEGDSPRNWAQKGAGAITGVVMMPGAAADGLALALGEKKLASPWLVGGVVTAVSAGIGLMCAGPVGAGIGAGVGALFSVRGASRTHQHVSAVVERIRDRADDLGDEVMNNNRTFTGGSIAGAAAGLRAGFTSWT